MPRWGIRFTVRVHVPMGTRLSRVWPGPAPLRLLRSVANPNGIPSLSPVLRGTSYAGCAVGYVINPERVASVGLTRWPAGAGWMQPRQGWQVICFVV